MEIKSCKYMNQQQYMKDQIIKMHGQYINEMQISTQEQPELPAQSK